jgi:hypothetical protein
MQMVINNTATMAQLKLDFRTAYCRVHHCSAEEFSRGVFRRSLHLRSLPFAGLLAWLYPRFFRNDLMLIDEVALATTRNECLVALMGYRQDCHMTGGFLHNQCRMRVSGKRLLNVFESTLHKAGAPSSEDHGTDVPQARV